MNYRMIQAEQVTEGRRRDRAIQAVTVAIRCRVALLSWQAAKKAGMPVSDDTMNVSQQEADDANAERARMIKRAGLTPAEVQKTEKAYLDAHMMSLETQHAQAVEDLEDAQDRDDQELVEIHESSVKMADAGLAVVYRERDKHGKPGREPQDRKKAPPDRKKAPPDLRSKPGHAARSPAKKGKHR